MSGVASVAACNLGDGKSGHIKSAKVIVMGSAPLAAVNFWKRMTCLLF